MNNNTLDKIISEIESGNFKTAIEHCDDILNKYPDNRSVYEIRSGCYYAIGDYDSAINDLTYSIVKLKSGENTKDELIGLYSKRGKIFLKKSDWKSASEDYKKILLLNQNNPEIQNSLAVCYRKMEKYIDALYHATYAIKLNSEFAEAYNNRANINISLEKFEDAINDYTKSIELNPLSANVYFNRGSIYYDIFNDKDKALHDFLKAIAIRQDLKEEINKHYPELFKVPEEKTEIKEDIILHEAPKQEPLPEIIQPKAEDTEIGFSLDEFDSLFNDKKQEPVIPVEEISKPDELKSPDFSSLFEKMDEDKSKTVSPKVTEERKTEDIIVPTFDLKSMFAEIDSSDEDLPQEEEPSLLNKPVITDDVKLLHNEIQAEIEVGKTSPGEMGGINFDSMSNFKKNESVSDKQPEREPFIQTQEEKKNFLRSPVFFIILIGLMGVIIILSVLKFFKTQENEILNVTTEVKVDSAVVKKTDTLKEKIKDTIKAPETKKEEVKKEETKKEEVKREEQPKKSPELTTKNLGFISDKKQFVLFSEPDGYYVQIGSYKEKSKADEKLKLLEKNKVKGKVFEVDLKEKGIFYRVRAGVFESPEEAKEKTVKLE